MGEQWHYLRGGNQVGPVSAAKLKELASSGQLSPTDMVWKEGIPNWVPAAKIKGLFAPPAEGVPPPVPVGSASPPSPAVPLSPLPPSPQRPRRRFWTPAKIVAFCGGGVVLALIGLIVVLLSGNGGGTGGGTGGDSSGPGGGNWGSPIDVTMDDGNTFRVALKDAFWTDYGESFLAKEQRKAFVLIYSFKNLGRRETDVWYLDAEIRTAKDHLYREGRFEDIGIRETRQGVGWWPKTTRGIEQTSEGALIFDLPMGEDPVELRIRKPREHSFKLTTRPFGFRLYSEVFGFLPEKREDAIAALTQALDAMEPSHKDRPDYTAREAAAAALETLEKLKITTPSEKERIKEARKQAEMKLKPEKKPPLEAK